MCRSKRSSSGRSPPGTRHKPERSARLSHRLVLECRTRMSLRHLSLPACLVGLVACLSVSTPDGGQNESDAGSQAGGRTTAGGGSAGGGSGGGMAALCMRAAGGSDYRAATQFITSVTVTGSFGGVLEAQARCNLAARGAGLKQVFLPWLTANATWPGAYFYSAFDDGPDAFKAPFGLNPFGPEGSEFTDEHGRALDAGFWTGFSTPCVAAQNCRGWTDASATGLVGSDPRPCVERHRLLCRSGPYFPGPLDAGPALGGLTGADSRCRDVGRDAGLLANFQAFLATTAIPAPSRFVDGGFWASVGSSEIIFLNDATLATTPRRALGEDETGATISPDEPVWTGTAPWAASTSNDCAAWTSTTGSGTRGSTGREDERWVDDGTQPCAQTAHLLCLEE